MLTQSCCTLQIHVFDKLDYCGSLKNLDAIASRPNFQVSRILPASGFCQLVQRPVLWSCHLGSHQLAIFVCSLRKGTCNAATF